MLRGVAIFGRCSDFDLRMISHRLEQRTFAEGEWIFREGDQGETMLLLTEGAVEVQRNGTVLRTVEAGGCLGELAAFSPAPRSADVLATSSVTAMELSPGAIRLILQTTPSVAEELIAALAQRVRELTPDE
jgi:CRP-like cAMP-binding protein